MKMYILKNIKKSRDENLKQKGTHKSFLKKGCAYIV